MDTPQAWCGPIWGVQTQIVISAGLHSHRLGRTKLLKYHAHHPLRQEDAVQAWGNSPVVGPLTCQAREKPLYSSSPGWEGWKTPLPFFRACSGLLPVGKRNPKHLQFHFKPARPLWGFHGNMNYLTFSTDSIMPWAFSSGAADKVQLKLCFTSQQFGSRILKQIPMQIAEGVTENDSEGCYLTW